jgi:hypothetical protein
MRTHRDQCVRFAGLLAPVWSPEGEAGTTIIAGGGTGLDRDRRVWTRRGLIRRLPVKEARLPRY